MRLRVRAERQRRRPRSSGRTYSTNARRCSSATSAWGRGTCDIEPGAFGEPRTPVLHLHNHALVGPMGPLNHSSISPTHPLHCTSQRLQLDLYILQGPQAP